MIWKNVGKLVVILAAVYLMFRFLLPWLLPFVAAILLVQGLQHWVEFAGKRMNLKRKAAVTLFCVGILGVMGLAGSRLILFFSRQGQEFLLYCQKSLPGWERQWWEIVGRWEAFFLLPPGVFRAALAEQLENLMTRATAYIAGWAPEQILLALAGSLKFFLVVGVTVMASLLLYQDYEKISTEIKAQSWYPAVARVGSCLSEGGLAWLKTQGIILCGVAFLTGLGLTILGYENAWFLGGLIGILDFLPILGAGTVLIPWTLVLLIQKDLLGAAGLGVIYLLCFFGRQYMEPRLMGQQNGIRPFYMLACIYLGLRLFGIWGVFLGPLGAALARGLYDEWTRNTTRA